jgi:hypothetical protein
MVKKRSSLILLDKIRCGADLTITLIVFTSQAGRSFATLRAAESSLTLTLAAEGSPRTDVYFGASTAILGHHRPV